MPDKSEIAGPGRDFSLPPYFAGYLDDSRQLRPLLVMCKNVTFFGAGKTALRAQTKLVDVDKLRGLVNTALQEVPGLENAGLRRHDPQHNKLVLRHQTQRLETSGPLRVVFHEV